MELVDFGKKKYWFVPNVSYNCTGCSLAIPAPRCRYEHERLSAEDGLRCLDELGIWVAEDEMTDDKHAQLIAMRLQMSEENR